MSLLKNGQQLIENIQAIMLKEQFTVNFLGSVKWQKQNKVKNETRGYRKSQQERKRSTHFLSNSQKVKGFKCCNSHTIRKYWQTGVHQKVTRKIVRELGSILAKKKCKLMVKHEIRSLMKAYGHLQVSKAY